MSATTGNPTYVLVDFENVQPKNMRLLEDREYRVLMFVGANQTRVPIELASALQQFGKNASYLQISGSGRNALDFHIAYYVGKLVSEDPSASIIIISKDSGFDPLIKHLRQNRVRAARHGDLAEIPALGMAVATSMEERVAGIVRNLTDRGQARPRKLSTLSNTINSLFAKSLPEDEVQALVRELESRGFAVFEQGRVSYNLNRGAVRGSPPGGNSGKQP